VLFFCRIKHFAGSVTYNVEGFLEKNRDTLEADLSRFMFHCQHPLLKLLFPEGELL
jgi:myosin-1